MISITTIGRAAAIAAGLTLIATAPAGAAPDPAKSAPKAPAAKNQRYCVESQVTGSRLSHRTCKTREEWIKSEGFDPVAK